MRLFYSYRILSRSIKILTSLITLLVVAIVKVLKKIPVIARYVAHKNNDVKVNAHMCHQEQLACIDELNHQRKQAEKEKYERQLIAAISKIVSTSQS